MNNILHRADWIMRTLLYSSIPYSRKFSQYEIFAVFMDDGLAAKISYAEIHYSTSFSVENWLHYRPSAKFYL